MKNKVTEKDLELVVKVAEKTIQLKDAEIDILIRKKQILRDEIAELRAEIERLEGRVEATEISKQKLLACFNCAKTEAIKEFWDKLKAKAHSEDYSITDSVDSVYVEDGNNLLKEMEIQPTKIEHNSLCETETYKSVF